MHSGDSSHVRLLKVVCVCVHVCVYACVHVSVEGMKCDCKKTLPSALRNIPLLQLDIIANIAGETSIHTVLREFKVCPSWPVLAW